MGYLDSLVLSATERLCRWFQQLTGRTNVWVAVQLTNLSVVVYFTWALNVYLASGDLTLRIFLALFCGGVILVLARTVFRESVEASEQDAYRRVAKGLANPRRIRDGQLRIAFLSLSVILGTPLVFAYVTLHMGIALLTYSLIILTTVLLYVLACDPLPPCKGKVREWIRAMARARAAQTT
ncbi:MAG: glycosyltransferase [Vicinamibacterales bacterium]